MDIREVLRRWEGGSGRQIAAATGLSRDTVAKYIKLAEKAGIQSASQANDQLVAVLQVVEPRVGSRLLVLDPATKNYAYVTAADVGASGAPPG